MKDLQINPIIKEAQFDELNDEERQLIELAIEGTSRSYAPHSNFHVGAAIQLKIPGRHLRRTVGNLRRRSPVP